MGSRWHAMADAHRTRSPGGPKPGARATPGADRRTVVATRLLRVDALRTLEAALQETVAAGELMERAGAAVARLAVTMTRERSGPIVVLVGPGNNGGDALVAARVLHEQGIEVQVALLGDAARFEGDALRAWTRWFEVGSVPIESPTAAASAALVIDGLFGIGFDRAPTGRARDWIEVVNAAHAGRTGGVPVLAVDVPSGVDGDTGHVADIAIEADRTLTFIAGKPGLVTGEAVDHVGALTVDPLGADRDDSMLERLRFEPGRAGTINRPALFEALRAPRRLNSHKGSNGSLLVVGGSEGTVGAALMASRMALHGGAGRVYVKLLAADAPGYDVLQPELMLRDSLDGIDPNAVAIGPGLGHDDAAHALLTHWLAAAPTLCVDADGLNAVARDVGLADLLAAREVHAVLTPHPLEAARLLASDVATVERDRVAAALELARKFNSVVVLKGAGTVIAGPERQWAINPTGNPALGTGGTGDVLCGFVGSLLAQHLSPWEAACAAVWLHGKAADDLVAAGVGPVGLAATELIPAIRDALNRLRAG